MMSLRKPAAALLLWANLAGGAGAQPPGRPTAEGTPERGIAEAREDPAGAETPEDPPDAGTPEDPTDAETPAVSHEDAGDAQPEPSALGETPTNRTAGPSEAPGAVSRVRVLDTPIEEERPTRTADDRRHAGTVALRLGAGVPYLFAIKYADGSPCESAEPSREPETFCSRLSEPFLDLELAYSITDQLELAGYATFGLRDDDAALARSRVFGVGVRGYTSPEAIVKGFFGARLVLDSTRSDTAGFRDFDLGLQGSFGLQVEPIRWLGIYLQGGVSVRVLRNFSFLPEASGGLQVRLP